MQFNSLGTPIISSKGDQQALTAFLAKLTAAVYGRLPRLVRLFLSEDALLTLLTAAAGKMATSF